MDDRGRPEDRVEPGMDYPQTTENRHGSVGISKRKDFEAFWVEEELFQSFYFILFFIFLFFKFFFMCLLDR